MHMLFEAAVVVELIALVVATWGLIDDAWRVTVSRERTRR